MLIASRQVRYIYQPDENKPGVAVEVVEVAGDRALIMPYGPASGMPRVVPVEHIKG